jgi:hypothetical protein
VEARVSFKCFKLCSRNYSRGVNEASSLFSSPVKKKMTSDVAKGLYTLKALLK